MMVGQRQVVDVTGFTLQTSRAKAKLDDPEASGAGL